MHDQLPQNVRQAINALCADEKLKLIEQLTQSVQASKNGGGATATARQKAALLESICRISALPIEGNGGFSGRDHDQVLYGRQPRSDTV